MSTLIDPLEINALVHIMDELDYYQLLNVSASATTAEIRRAFHASSRNFHPDANRHLAHDLRDRCGLISKRITEAYCVLRDTRRRKSYDAKRAEGQTLRIQLAEAKSAHAEQRKAEIRGATAQGRQYHGKAEAAIKSGNLAAALQHIQMAIAFEPGNAGFKTMAENLKAKRKAQS